MSATFSTEFLDMELVSRLRAQLASRPRQLTIKPNDVAPLSRHIAACGAQSDDVHDVDDIADQLRRGVVQLHGIPIRVAA